MARRPYHELPELLYKLLEDEGFFDEESRPAGRRSRTRSSRSRTLRMPSRRSRRKAPRKVSRYQKEFGRQLKKLKKKHPRTPVTKLMKRAHAATRRALGMKRRR